MKSQLRFVMHADDEASLLRELLQESAVLLIDGPRWKQPTPQTARSLSSIGNYCIVWSPEDISELTSEYVANTNDWYCRSEHSTIQFLRSRMTGAVLTEGRFAVWTDPAPTARNLSTRVRQRWFEFSEPPRRRATSAWVG
jgi:hypothetical protein